MIELSLAAFQEKLNSGYTVLDLRNPQEFASGFIPGSIFFSDDVTSEQFSPFLRKNTPLVIIGNQKEANPKTGDLSNLGFQIGGIYYLSIDEWKKTGRAIDLIIDIDAEELAMDLRFDPSLVLVDIRDEEQFKQAHVMGAMNLPLPEMADVAQIAGLDEKGCVYFYGMSDANALLAGSLMKRQGLHNLRVVRGGWKAIVDESSIEIEKEAKLKR